MSEMATVDRLVASAEDRRYVAPAKRLVASTDGRSVTRALIVSSLTALGRASLADMKQRTHQVSAARRTSTPETESVRKLSDREAT